MDTPEKGYKNLRLGRVSVPGASYYITQCTRNRKRGLDNPVLFRFLLEAFYEMKAEGIWSLRILAVMPDHIHAVIRLGEVLTYSEAIRIFKGRSSVRLRHHRLAWQPGGGYEHRMRPDEPLLPVFHYIFMNPYRKGLIEASAEWPRFYICPEDGEWFVPTVNDGLPYPEWLREP